MNRLGEQLADAWAARTERERWMLIGLGVVIGALAFWYGLATPLNRAAEAAERRHLTAADQLAQSRSLAREVAMAEQMRGGARQSGPPSATVRQAAAAAGVTLSREQPQGDGTLGVWTEPASAKAVFGWLTMLQREHGVGVRSFEAHRGQAGAIEVRVVFAGAGA